MVKAHLGVTERASSRHVFQLQRAFISRRDIINDEHCVALYIAISEVRFAQWVHADIGSASQNAFYCAIPR